MLYLDKLLLAQADTPLRAKLEKKYSAKVVTDHLSSGIPSIIVTGNNVFAPCLYVQVPDAFLESVKRLVNVHGDFTFEEQASVKGYTWLGWDYAHPGDYIDIFEKQNLTTPEGVERYNQGKHKWTEKELLQELSNARSAIEEIMSPAQKEAR